MHLRQFWRSRLDDVIAFVFICFVKRMLNLLLIINSSCGAIHLKEISGMRNVNCCDLAWFRLMRKETLDVIFLSLYSFELFAIVVGAPT